MTFQQTEFANCPGQPPFAGNFPVSNSTTCGAMDLYRGTRESVNTFYALLERETGVCEPFKLAKDDGRRADQPEGRPARLRRRAGADLHPRRRQRQPAGDGRGLRDLRRPRPALRRPAGHLDRGRGRQPAQGVPRAVHAGAAAGDRRRGQRRAARRPGAGRLRLRHRPAARRPVGRQDRHHPGRQVRLVRGLHPAARDRRDDRRRRRGRAGRAAGRPDHRRRLHPHAPPAPASPARCGATRCRRSTTGSPTTTSWRRRPSTSHGVQTTVPAPAGWASTRPSRPWPTPASRRPTAATATPATPPAPWPTPTPAPAAGRPAVDSITIYHSTARRRPAEEGQEGDGTRARTRRAAARTELTARPVSRAGGVPPRRRRRRRRGP